MNLYVRERSSATGLFHCADEVLGTLERNDFTGWSDDFCKIDSRVPRARAHIQDAFAHGDTGSLPAIQNYRTPDTMLQSEPCQFLIVSTQNVIAIHVNTLNVRKHGCMDEIRAPNSGGSA
jgi:hypothetical protein